MSSPAKSNKRIARRTPKSLKTAIAVCLAAVPAVGLFLAGSTLPWQLAVLHGIMAMLLLLSARLGAESMAKTGRPMQLLVALMPLVGVLALGLLPLPMAVLQIVSPGVAAAYPDASWHTLSMNAESTITELGVWALLVSYAAAVGLWGSRGRKAVNAETAMFVGSLCFMAFALAHVATGATSIAGIVSVSDPQEWFFAPFVNANFFGTVLLLALPLAVGEAASAWRQSPMAAAPFAVFSALLLCFMLALGSFSTLGALSIQFAMLLFHVKGVPAGSRTMLVFGGVGALVAAFVAMVYNEPDWFLVSVQPRLTQWSDAPSFIAAHWFAGVGGGAHAEAYHPFRSVLAYLQYTHAHNDLLQWVIETGLMGLVAFGATVWLFPRSVPGERRRLWTIGLVGATASACWNFPFQVPAIALVFMGMLAIRATCFDEPEQGNPARYKLVLLALAVLQLPLGAWQVRNHFVDGAIAVLEAPAAAPSDELAAEKLLRMLAPNRPQIGLHVAWTAEREQRTEAAIEMALTLEQEHPSDARTLRRAALILWRAERTDDALRLLDRAAVRDPNDFRTWVAISRIQRERAEGGKALSAFAEALRHWPKEQAGKGEPLDEGWSLAPMGEYWVDALSDAPAWWSWRLAQRLLRAKEPQLAMVALQQATEMEPIIYTNVALWVDVLLANDRVPEAEALAKRLTNDRPGDAWNWEGLGEVYEHKGEYDRAVTTYLQGFSVNRHKTHLALRAVRAANMQGGPNRALQIVKQVDPQVRNDPRFDLEVARLHLAAGESAECMLRLEDGKFAEDALGQRARSLFTRCGGRGEL